MTDEERQSIVNEAVEKALLALPKVIGNLITTQLSLLKINRKFYEKFPDFSNAKDLVATIVEKLENDAPGTDYEKLLEQAVPLIRAQIKTIKSLDTKSVTKPSLDLSSVKLSDHGEL